MAHLIQKQGIRNWKQSQEIGVFTMPLFRHLSSLLALVLVPFVLPAQPRAEEVLASMRKAADFMMSEMSHRGGFVWKISEDGELRYGELKARDSMIWVEPPGTPTVGLVFIEAYRVTGDETYLDHARKTANALIRGQRPEGGWHYFIDFDMPGLPDYYDEYFSKRWGWEEHTKYYDNSTFDDDVTYAAALLLLRLYDETLDPAYRPALDKALGFVLESQYPNGAWPQRYPLKDDYTAYYTFNDGAISNNIHLLLEAHDTLGMPGYLEAARRGMDFYIISQQASPQAGWGQQHNFDMVPAGGRKFEIGALSSDETVDNVRDLLTFYKATGDRRYLEPVPKALEWLESAPRNEEGRFTRFYELGTNRPIYSRSPVIVDHVASFERTHDPAEAYPYGLAFNLNIEGLWAEYRRVKGLDPETARAEFESERASERLRPTLARKSRHADYRTVARGPGEIAELVASIGDGRGWVLEDVLLDEDHFIDNPPWEIVAYDTGTYVARLYRLINHLHEREGR